MRFTICSINFAIFSIGDIKRDGGREKEREREREKEKVPMRFASFSMLLAKEDTRIR